MSIIDLINSLPGAVAQGLIWGIMAIGVYITYRILDFADLTVDGSICTGGAVCVMMITGGYSIPVAVLTAFLAGLLAGLATGLFHTFMGIPPILAGILTQLSLYSINLKIMSDGKPNISILGSDTLYSNFMQLTGCSKHTAYLIVSLIICVIVLIAVEFFFKTHLGLCICATGDNEDMVRATSIDPNKMKWIALALANGCVALSGAMYTQYMGYADVTAGSGTIVVGFASVIIGETICGKRGLSVGFISAIVGSVAYRIIIAIAIKTNLFPTYFLKLVSVIIIAIALGLGPVRAAFAAKRNKTRRQKANA